MTCPSNLLLHLVNTTDELSPVPRAPWPKAEPGGRAQVKIGSMFDPRAYGDEIAAILALDGNGERLIPLAGGTCSSAEARNLLNASRLPLVVLAGLYLYFLCWDEGGGAGP